MARRSSWCKTSRPRALVVPAPCQPGRQTGWRSHLCQPPQRPAGPPARNPAQAGLCPQFVRCQRRRLWSAGAKWCLLEPARTSQNAARTGREGGRRMAKADAAAGHPPRGARRSWCPRAEEVDTRQFRVSQRCARQQDSVHQGATGASSCNWRRRMPERGPDRSFAVPVPPKGGVSGPGLKSPAAHSPVVARRPRAG